MKRVLVFLMALLIPTSLAAQESKTACIFDYLRYCSAFRIGTDELKICLEKNGLKLSSGCLKALIDDGLVTRAYINEKAKEKGLVARLTGNGIEFRKDMSAMSAASAIPAATPPPEEAKDPAIQAVEPPEEAKDPAIPAATPPPEEAKDPAIQAVEPPEEAKDPAIQAVEPPEDPTIVLAPSSATVPAIKKEAKAEKLKRVSEKSTEELNTKVKEFKEKPRRAHRYKAVKESPKEPSYSGNDYYKREAEKDPIGSRNFPGNSN